MPIERNSYDEGMRVIDAGAEKAVDVAQVYLTADEAASVHKRLGRLLQDPEANEHFHVVDGSRDLSFSIATRKKLSKESYTPLEREILEGMCGPP